MISNRRTHPLMLAAALATGPTACALSDAAAAPDDDAAAAPDDDEAAAAAALDTRIAAPNAVAPALQPRLAAGAGIDLDGDGRADVCGRGIAGISCGLSTGASFGPVTLWSTGFNDAGNWNRPQYYTTIQFPDVNGDGRTDVCGRGIAGISCALSTGASFGPVTLWSTGFNDAGNWNLPQYYTTIRFPDVNGDGRADVCGRGTAGISCALSTGTGFTAPTLWTAGFNDAQGWNNGPQYYATLRFPDVNGDGRADVCGRGASGVVCALSDGVTFAPESLWTPAFTDAQGWNNGPQYYATLRFPDVNGDGRADVCGRGADGVICALSDGVTFAPDSLWTPTFTDAQGWNSGPQYYSTLQFP